MFGKGNFQNILKQAKNVQKKIEETQAELEKLVLIGQAGGGMVEAKINGKYELLSLKIDPDLLGDDIEMIEDLVVAAVNQGVKKANKASQKKMSSVSGSMMSELGNLNLQSDS
ncbi:MAG: hypothetical protein CMG75_01785 [Candidatus Marinimicrobia bacterium]|nr:hypothetical protein [Candidatus Neomarinimicrobiota bacterium]|tara:strand:- start:11283 stop:11621 length:339 start_codon:yes stop_codon:yes gene_type:complete